LSTALAENRSTTLTAQTVESVLLGGDLSKLSAEQRVSYYQKLCDSLGLNPLTKPFDYITLNGKLTLYARKDCTEQLRAKRHVSVTIAAREISDDCYVVSAKATLPDGRADESIGAVSIAGLKGEARANALMKAETKAKRRVTLSICGLGMLDETEVETITPPVYAVTAPINVEPSDRGSPGFKAPAFAPQTAPHQVGDPRFPVTTAAPVPDGQLRIAKLELNQTKNPNVQKALITLSTGEVVTTINSRLIALCEQLCQDQIPVTVETKQTKWGTDLLAAHRVTAPLPELQINRDLVTELEGPVDVDEIPFAWLLPLILPAMLAVSLWT
jgi:hypothetical protein